MPALVEIARALVLLLVPLAAWRLGFSYSDWAALALVALGVAIWLGVYRPRLSRRRAELEVVVIPGSALGHWFTGRMGAGLTAGASVLVGVPVLAWVALRSPPLVIAVLLALCVVAGLLSQWAIRVLGRSLTPPFARVMGHGIGSTVAALLALLPLVWLNWAVIAVPHEITSVGLSEAVAAQIAQLPPRAGWLREGLGLFAALDGAKLWLAAQHREALWVGLIFSVDAALVSFVVARSFVAVMEFGRLISGRDE
ncbi:hypothetical protein [Paracoccus aestuariivivens]|uniref:Uncharacterized protein n=1 Tax=Paracoccus aestuariivivens TaxID=1820333 RepID=A0A6L6J3U7_9RHOB|nr:hypothetical protein [Paracoccus aestuariivivens]MTH76226.1 hypothetical protein [Paracoccus aestuariivivens]